MKTRKKYFVSETHGQERCLIKQENIQKTHPIEVIIVADIAKGKFASNIDGEKGLYY